MLKKLFKIFVVLFVVIFSIGCSDSKPDKLIVDYENDLNKSVPNDFIIITGRDKEINVFAIYDNGSQINITDSLIWSSDKNLTTVSKGLVRAKELTGEVVISYKTKEKLSDGLPVYNNSITLGIENRILEEITLSKTTLALLVGASQNITAKGIFEKDFTDDITSDCNWTSSDKDIAIVDDNGSVTGKLEGKVTITATDRDTNITSNTLEVTVEKVVYSSLNIESIKTDFNVKQTIQLEARATNDRNEIVSLNNSYVTWDSDNTTIITIDDNGLATAQAKGSAIITANITDSDEKDTITLNVIKDEYMRLFQDVEELEFPYVSAKGYETLPTDFSKFTIVAVGRDFIISELNVTDINGTAINSGFAWFDGLENDDKVGQDNNMTFTLKRDDSKKELNYHFKIDDDSNSTFDIKYYETNN